MGLIAAVFIGSGAVATRMQMDEDITAALPSSDPLVSDYRLVVTRFKGLESIFIDVGAECDSADPTSDIVSVADAFAGCLAESGLFEKIHYRISAEQAGEILSTLSNGRASLLSPQDCEKLEPLLSLEHIRSRLREAKRALIEPSGAFVRSHLRRDPLGFNEVLLEKLRSVGRAENASISDGRIWSSDSRHLLMIATPRSPAMDTGRGIGVIEEVERARQAALRCVPAGAVRISYIGGHRAALDNAQTIQKDVKRSLTITSLGILVLGLLVFRRKSFVAMMFLPAAFGIACATIGFGLFNPTVSAVTVGCSALLVGISVDYGVHVLYRFDNLCSDSGTPFTCVRSMLLPLAMGACTTAGGLLCLLLLALPGQRQVGLLGAIGVFGAFVCTAAALPFLLPFTKPKRGWTLPLSDWCHRFLAWRRRHGTAFFLIGLGALVAGLSGVPHVAFEGDVTKMNYLRADSRLDEKRVQDVWGGFSMTSVVVRGQTRQEALAANDRLYPLLQEFVAEGKVANFTSIAPILPAASTQNANRARWRTFWSEQRRQIVRERIAHVSKELGFASEAFRPFQEDLAGPCLPVEAAHFEGIGLDSVLDRHIAGGEGEHLVLNTVSLADGRHLQEVTSRIHSALPGTVVMNRRRFVEHTADLVRGEVRMLAVAAGIVMFACLLLFLRRIELVLAVVLPVVFSLLVTMGFLGLAGIKINLISCLFIVFVFGVGIDYSIFLLNSALDTYRGHEKHQAVTFGAVVICVLTTLCGFVALSTGEHPAMFSIGIAGVVGMLSSLLAAVVVVPMITAVLLPNEGRHGTPSFKTWIGGVLGFGYIVSTTTFYLVVIYPIIYLRHLKSPQARQSFTRRHCQKITSAFFRYFPYRDSERIYVGLEGKPFSRPAVIVANHASAFDIFAMLSLPTEMVMMVKRWVWHWPPVGWMLRAAGYVLTDGQDVDNVLELATARLSQGAHVTIFPEGSRSQSGRMRRFHKGAFELAVRTQADIIPVLITNSQACIPWKSAWLGDHRCIIRVLPKISPQTFRYSRGSSELARYVKEQMLEYENTDWRLAQDGKAFWHNIRSLYNYRGAFVESYIAWKLRLDPIYRRVDEFVSDAGVVIDVGCGYGLMSNILARKSLRRNVIGIDVDSRRIRVAQATALAVPNAQFELGNVLDAELPEADVVLLVDVLHYWSKEKQRDLIAKACNALHPGGVLVFRDACRAKGWSHRLTAWSERIAARAGHSHRGEGLHFCEEEFYLRTFDSHGLTVQERPTDMGRGSNGVLILRRSL